MRANKSTEICSKTRLCEESAAEQDRILAFEQSQNNLLHGMGRSCKLVVTDGGRNIKYCGLSLANCLCFFRVEVRAAG